MGKKLDYTSRSVIKSVLHRYLWLRSRERINALKRDKYTCCRCGKKQSRKKDHIVRVEGHHKKGVSNWDAICDEIYKELLCEIKYIETLCKKCHSQETMGV